MTDTWTRSHAIALGVLGALLGGSLHAQDEERFGDRLAMLPIDVATATSRSGSGRVDAILRDDTLTLAGRFAGLSSPATVAHIHQAPLARRGPALFAIEVSNDTAGTIGGMIELTSTQVERLRESELYVQVHTEANPDGEIRGWLIPERPTKVARRQPASYGSHQARNGETAFNNSCASCHQRDLSGGLDAPKLTGPSFLGMWHDRPASDLFDYIKAAMPPAGRKPPDNTLTDIVAYILHENGRRSSDSVLTATSSGTIGASTPADISTPPIPR